MNGCVDVLIRTICPAPITPNRFTSAAGLAAVELKYLTRLESRRVCRAAIIEAAIVGEESCEERSEPKLECAGDSWTRAANLGPGHPSMHAHEPHSSS